MSRDQVVEQSRSWKVGHLGESEAQDAGEGERALEEAWCNLGHCVEGLIFDLEITDLNCVVTEGACDCSQGNCRGRQESHQLGSFGVPLIDVRQLTD